ncbi:MAG: efflux transporter periplasmic adaptor subunit [Deltaproteobacteria bacterium RIFOXYD12_FULL_57_12]|nr:MAG: efflux transporter periplasmic adaptor subunit [Deltaproteobacteria bacterium RIFOXYD12_FULL_57_12]
MNKTLAVFFAVLLGAAYLAGCSRPEDAPAASAVMKPAVAVEVTKLAATTVEEAVAVTGSLAPKFEAEVKTQIPGLVREVYVTEWVQVKKGQPLARIDLAETEAATRRAQAAIASAKSVLAEAKAASIRADRERTRTEELKAAGLATRQQAEDAASEAAATTARMEATQGQLQAAEEELRQVQSRLAKGLVLSPLDGIVAARNVNVGDLTSDAATAKPIFVIVDNRILDLTVTVPSPATGRIAVGQTVVFSTEALPGQTFIRGRVTHINPRLEAADRSLKVMVEVENSAGLLKGGMFVSGRIITGQKQGVLRTPRAALVGWNMETGQAGLFVVEGKKARLRQVTTGSVQDDLVEIVSGVAAGEHYVLRGGFTLKDGDDVQVAAAKAGGGK